MLIWNLGRGFKFQTHDSTHHPSFLALGQANYRHTTQSKVLTDWPTTNGVCESKVAVGALSPKPTNLRRPTYQNIEYTCSHFPLFNLNPLQLLFGGAPPSSFLPHTYSQTGGWGRGPAFPHVKTLLPAIMFTCLYSPSSISFLSFYPVGQTAFYISSIISSHPP